MRVKNLTIPVLLIGLIYLIFAFTKNPIGNSKAESLDPSMNDSDRSESLKNGSHALNEISREENSKIITLPDFALHLDRFVDLEDKAILSENDRFGLTESLNNKKQVELAFELLGNPDLIKASIDLFDPEKYGMVLELTKSLPELADQYVRLKIIDYIIAALNNGNRDTKELIWSQCEILFQKELPTKSRGTTPKELLSDKHRQELGDRLELFEALSKVDEGRAKKIIKSSKNILN